jgi:hypothetical protein
MIYGGSINLVSEQADEEVQMILADAQFAPANIMMLDFTPTFRGIWDAAEYERLKSRMARPDLYEKISSAAQGVLKTTESSILYKAVRVPHMRSHHPEGICSARANQDKCENFPFKGQSLGQRRHYILTLESVCLIYILSGYDRPQCHACHAIQNQSKTPPKRPHGPFHRGGSIV